MWKHSNVIVVVGSAVSGDKSSEKFKNVFKGKKSLNPSQNLKLSSALQGFIL